MFETWGALESMARDRQRDILAEAARASLVRRYGTTRRKAARPRWRLGTWVGRGLVALGTRMQEPSRRSEVDLGLRKAG